MSRKQPNPPPPASGRPPPSPAPPPCFRPTPGLLNMADEAKDLEADKARADAPPSVAQALREVQKMRASLPMMVEYYVYDAERKRARFDAYIKAGFTESQALVLCGQKD